jgi:hypothetical protein
MGVIRSDDPFIPDNSLQYDSSSDRLFAIVYQVEIQQEYGIIHYN